MLNAEVLDIIEKSKAWGWVLEPCAKSVLSLAGMSVPSFKWAQTLEEALLFAEENGYPLVAKVVSPKVIHKTEQRGVWLNLRDEKSVTEAFQELIEFDGAKGVLIEESMKGLELIVGAKIDLQFGPVILMGIGGTSVEIYQDTSLRMAPLNPEDVKSMMSGLKAHRILDGYRGSEPVNREALTRMLMAFSELVMALDERISSIDLNPVFCTAERCVVGDARIMLPA